MTDAILCALLVSSLCAVGTFFLKWCEALKTIAYLKKENLRLEAEKLEAQRQVAEEKAKNEKNSRTFAVYG